MTFYAASTTDPWWPPNRLTAELSCSGPVIAIECEESSEGYYAYRDERGGYPIGAFSSIDVLSMCFPYGLKVALKEGVLVRVRRKG